MNKKARQTAIALHVASVIFTIFLLAGGILARYIKSRNDETMSRTWVEVLDSKLRPKIGTPYTDAMHHTTLEFCADLDSFTHTLGKGFGQFATLAITLGSFLLILNLANLFLLNRTFPKEP